MKGDICGGFEDRRSELRKERGEKRIGRERIECQLLVDCCRKGFLGAVAKRRGKGE